MGVGDVVPLRVVEWMYIFHVILEVVLQYGDKWYIFTTYLSNHGLFHSRGCRVADVSLSSNVERIDSFHAATPPHIQPSRTTQLLLCVVKEPTYASSQGGIAWEYGGACIMWVGVGVVHEASPLDRVHGPCACGFHGWG